MMSPSPFSLLVALCLSPSLLALTQLTQSPYWLTLLPVAGVAVVAGVVTYWLIPPIAALNLAADLYGIDINKKGMNPEADKDPKKVPEAAGIVPVRSHAFAAAMET